MLSERDLCNVLNFSGERVDDFISGFYLGFEIFYPCSTCVYLGEVILVMFCDLFFVRKPIFMFSEFILIFLFKSGEERQDFVITKFFSIVKLFIPVYLTQISFKLFLSRLIYGTSAQFVLIQFI